MPAPCLTKKQARKRAEKIAARKAQAPHIPDITIQERADTIPPPAPNLHSKPGQPPTLYLYLDDERPCPEGWTSCRWPQEVIDHAEQAAREGRPVVMSLDHDLGESGPNARTGYDVLTWLEERAYYDPAFPLPIRLRIHTANPVAREKMRSTRAAIYTRRRASMLGHTQEEPTS